MKNRCFGSIALIALSAAGTAGAADMPVRAPVYKAAPAAIAAYNWTGWYAGGNIGYSWGRAKSDLGFPDLVAGAVNVLGFAGSDSVKLKGVIGGGQIGYNWQTAPNWVFGFETDFQGSGEKGSLVRSDPFAFDFALCGGAGCVGASTTDYTAKINWFGTVRGRIGYAWDRVFWYGTGGLAYGRVNVSGLNTTTVTAPFAGTFVIPFSASKVNTGWTLGAGIEGVAWDPRWTWKLEYLYMDLGKLDISESTRTLVTGETTFLTAGNKFTTKFTDNIVRFGLNYRFGDVGKGPMVARY